MRNEQTGENKDNPKNHSIPPVSAKNAEANKKILDANNTTKPTKQRQTKTPIYKRIISFLRNERNQSLIANFISFLMFVVTGILALYTYKVFHQTIKQTEAATASATAAKISADAAKRSADLQKQALDSQIAAKKQSDISDAKKLGRDTLFIKKQTNGINTQIKALKETQKEFEIENRPFVQAFQFNFDTLEANKHVCISYEFINYGKQPVRCLINKYAIKFDTTKKFTATKNPRWIYGNITAYLSGQVLSQTFFISESKISAEEVKAIRDGKIFTFVYGTLTFKNTVTGVLSKYQYCYRLAYYTTAFGADAVEDTTIVIKK